MGTYSKAIINEIFSDGHRTCLPTSLGTTGPSWLGGQEAPQFCSPVSSSLMYEFTDEEVKPQWLQHFAPGFVFSKQNTDWGRVCMAPLFLSRPFMGFL